MRACDLAAASPNDKQRPADVPGVYDENFKPSVAIPPCEAAVRVAPQDPRMLFELGRGYYRAGRFAEALPLLVQAAQMGNPHAANYLGLVYAKGQGVAVDLKAQAYYLNQAAQAGLAAAQFNLAMILIKGNAAVPKDEGLARQWLSLAAKNDNLAAMFSFGLMLDRGMGGNQDAAEARSWYEKAALAGSLDGMDSFGMVLQSGRGGPQDSVEARKWFEKAATRNHPGATTRLGLMFRDGLGGPQDFDEARRLFKKAIALGETQYAPKNLAALDQTHPAAPQGALVAPQPRAGGPAPPAALAQGIAPEPTESPIRACDLAAASPHDKQRPAGVPGVYGNAFSPSVAISACEAAVRAAPQDPRMLYGLARGYDAAERFAEAFPLYRQAAQMGNASAANALAVMYAKGEGVEVDPKGEAYYLNQAAQAGLSVAQGRLGFLYSVGNAALPKDERLARQWTSLAAKDNVPPAMFNLARMLENGTGGYRDPAEARRWYEKAANANHPGATARLGLMFQDGLGGPRDVEEARRLFKKAIALGERQYAPKNLAELDRTHPAARQDAPATPQPPAGGPAPPAFVVGTTSFVMVAFQPNVSEGDVNALLQAYNLTLAEGPNADGLFKLRFAAPLPADQLQLVLDSMRTQTKVVRSATSG